MLAADKIIVPIGGSSVELHPSLRAALRIARRHDGFAAPLRAILDGNASLTASLIEDGADTNTAIPDLMDEIVRHGLAATLNPIADPLSRFILALAGADKDAKPTSKPAKPTSKPAKPVDIVASLERMFGIATGHLGWTAEAAWSATPDEIIAAFNGRQDLLRSIFGGTDDADATPPTVPSANSLDPSFDPTERDPAFDQAGWNELKSLIRQGKL